MENEYIISVIVPVFNAQKYLKKCLDSVCVQACENIQVVIIDDGSNDGSAMTCDKYDEKYEHVLVVHKENTGLVATRKMGVEIATGRYIAFVDADDWIEEDFFSKAINFLVNGNIDILAFDCIKEFDDYSVRWGNKVIPGTYNEKNIEVIKDKAIFSNEELVPWTFLPNIWAKIIDKKLIYRYINNVDNAITYGEDAACFFPCLWNSNSLLVVDEAPYHYLQHNQSMSNRFEQIDSWIIEEIVNCLSKSQYMNDRIKSQIKLYEFYLHFLRNYSYFDRYGMTLFPFSQVKKNDKIVIYGAGGFGKSILDYIKKNKCVNVQAVVDKKGDECSTQDYKVDGVELLAGIEFDYIVVAVLNEAISWEIRNFLIETGVESNKILLIDLECLLKIEKETTDG